MELCRYIPYVNAYVCRLHTYTAITASIVTVALVLAPPHFRTPEFAFLHCLHNLHGYGGMTSTVLCGVPTANTESKKASVAG